MNEGIGREGGGDAQSPFPVLCGVALQTTRVAPVSSLISSLSCVCIWSCVFCDFYQKTWDMVCFFLQPGWLGNVWDV